MPMYHFKFPIGDVMQRIGGPVNVEATIRRVAREAGCKLDIDRVVGTDRVMSLRCEEGPSESHVILVLGDFPSRQL